MIAAGARILQTVEGSAAEGEPLVRRIVAPNQSDMTYRGTNTYLVGQGEVAVIDPGPDDDAHLRRIENELGTCRRVVAILITHSHIDHTALARRLSGTTGAPVMAYSGAAGSASDRMASLSAIIDLGGGEGLDRGFEPDKLMEDGESVSCDEWNIRAVWTPGHTANHLCFELADTGILFSGDHVMGWSTTIVSPPDGDMGDFMRSLNRLSERNDTVYYPGHGDPVTEPAAEVRRQLDHRMTRERQILDALQSKPQNTYELALHIYSGLPDRLKAAAERNVLAHVLDLVGKGRVHPINQPGIRNFKFKLIER